MKSSWPWFERSFSFAFPPAKLPEIIERLGGTGLRLRSLVESLAPPVLTWQDGETWSIQENAGHLVDLEPLWWGRIEDIVHGLEVMREADLTNRATHQANHNIHEITDILNRFDELRQRLVDRLMELDLSQAARSSRHPRLNTPMRIVDLAHFVAEHDDYHLARIRLLKRIQSR